MWFPPTFSFPDPVQNLASPPDPLASEHLHYTETESDRARLSIGQTDTFLVPALDIAKLNAIVEPHLANSRLQSYLKGNARMFTQYLAHLKNKLPRFKMFRKTPYM